MKLDRCSHDDCNEPILAEDVCYDHAKCCSRCGGPCSVGTCRDIKRCDEHLEYLDADRPE